MNKDVHKDLKKQIEDLEAIKSTDSKEVIKDKLNKEVDVLKKIYTTDAFQNQMARLGFGQPNLANGAEYPITRLSQNYNLFTSLYRSSWIARKIIDVFPSDMLKNWIKITSNIEPSQIKKIESAVRKTGTKRKLKKGLKWARLYGGAAGLILIDGQDDLSEPLDYDLIMPGSYKGLLVFDRWNGIYPDIELEDDINDTEFGLPKYYNISLSSKNTGLSNMIDSLKDVAKVHHSRIIRFEGRDLPEWERQGETYWGESELEIVLEELKKRDNTSFNIASLTFLANIRVLKMADLGQLLGAGSQQAKENLYSVIEAQNHLMSNMGIYVMDKDDDFSTEQYSFSGLSDIYESFMLDIAGACEMPVTKLFGRNPAGFNATGESDLTQYCDTVEEKQETYLMPVIDKLLPIICMSCLGSVPEDLDWEFNPFMSVSNKDLADLAQQMASPIFDAFSNGLINKSTALKELKQQTDKTGMWSNITDELITQAESEDDNSDISEEEQNNIYSEISPDDPDLSSKEQNDTSNINPQSQNENSPEDKLKPQTDNKYGWRDRVADLFRLGI